MPYVLRRKTAPFQCVFIDYQAATYIPDTVDLADLIAAGIKVLNVDSLLFDAHLAALGVKLPE